MAELSNNENSLAPRRKYSLGIKASFGSKGLFIQWIQGAFGFSVYFYYESVIGLDSLLVAVAFVIYSIWNAINDPLFGYLMDRIKWPWIRRTGFFRFPLLLLVLIPWLLSYLMIFYVPLSWNPVSDKWPIFIWYTISICLNDSMFSIYDINTLALYPDKFVTDKDRRLVQGLTATFGVIGIVLSAIIPPQLIKTGIPSTYQYASVITVLVAIPLFLFTIPGTFEDKNLRTLNSIRLKEAKVQNVRSFRETMKNIFSNKNFMIKIVFFLGYNLSSTLIQNSTLYVTTYILDREASIVTILSGGMLVGSLLSIPIWVTIAQKTNNHKTINLAATIIMFISFIPMIFVDSVIGFAVSLFIFGIGVGGNWFVDPPTMIDIVEDAAVRYGRREYSVYFGVQAFFIRFSRTFQAIIFAVVHMLTGFVEGATSREELFLLSDTPELALFGIRIHAAIIPAIFLPICIYIFWRYYDLIPKRIKENKEKLIEMKII